MAIVIDADKTRTEINLRGLKSTLIYFEEKYGKNELNQFIESTGMPLDYIQNEHNWVSFNYYKEFFDKLVDYTKDTKSPFVAGTYTASRKAYGLLQVYFTRLASIKQIYKLVAMSVSRYGKVADWKIVSLKNNNAILELRYFSQFKQSENNCQNIQGQLASIPTVYGMPLAIINHPKCEVNGDDCCLYEVSWINPASRKFGLLGIGVGALLFYLLEHFNLMIDFNWINFLCFLLLGSAIGRVVDYKIFIAKGGLNDQSQSEALLNSLQEIENLNISLQAKVEERTDQLRQVNDDLSQAYKDLKNQEMQLIHSEKMAGLGNLVAGIAHEINTPAGMIQSAAKFNVSQSDSVIHLLFRTITQIHSVDHQSLFLNFLESLLHAVMSREGILSIKEEQKIYQLIKEKLKPDLSSQKLARALSELGYLGDVQSLVSLVDHYPDIKWDECVKALGRFFQNIKNIEYGTIKIANLVKALKTYSSLDEAKLKEVNIHQDLELCLTILSHNIKGGIEIERKFDPVPNILGYGDEMNQVWTNIIINAIQAMKGKGKILIHTFLKDDWIHVAITDNGPGIPENVISKIFDPFFTTKDVGEGTGLGLGICRQIVNKHQGNIHVQSRSGETTFDISIPVKQDEFRLRNSAKIIAVQT